MEGGLNCPKQCLLEGNVCKADSNLLWTVFTVQLCDSFYLKFLTLVNCFFSVYPFFITFTLLWKVFPIRYQIITDRILTIIQM